MCVRDRRCDWGFSPELRKAIIIHHFGKVLEGNTIPNPCNMTQVVGGGWYKCEGAWVAHGWHMGATWVVHGWRMGGA